MINYKRFQVVNKNDYLIYLRQIIVQLNRYFVSLEKYILDMEKQIETLNLLKEPNKKIDSGFYEENRDKTQYIENKILNLLGDMQSDSISYNKFRRTLVKRNIEVKQVLGKIPEELSQLLNEMNSSRNWGLHEPESLLNAHLENIQEFWPKEELEWYLNNFNPIFIASFEGYEGAWLVNLYQSCKSNLNYYKSIYEYIKKDYGLLIEGKGDIEIVFNSVEIRPFELEIKLPKTSFEMQQNKYQRR